MRRRARPTTRADESPEFIAFWTLWKERMNRNDGRGSARDEFFRHVEEDGVHPQDIVDGARWFYHNGGNAGDYRVHAQTWLNRRAYEDGCEAWRTYQARLSARSENVVPMVKPVLPENHFSRQWAERKQAAE